MKKYLKAYLYNRPLFYSFIRPKELELFTKEMPFRKPILDFGCGDGFFAGTLFQGKKIDVGIDINEKVILEALGSGVYKKAITFNGKKLPFSRGYFSTVISNCVLEHVENLPLILREINRVIKRGGFFYLTVMTDMWNDHLIGGSLFGKRYIKWMKKIQIHYNLLSQSEWEKLFEKSGFKVIEKVGYIDKKTSHLIELFHYLSVDSLISYKLFKKWVLFPLRFKVIENLILKRIRNTYKPKKNSSTVFYALKKI